MLGSGDQVQDVSQLSTSVCLSAVVFIDLIQIVYHYIFSEIDLTSSVEFVERLT